MRIYVSLIMFVLAATSVSAQKLTFEWERTYQKDHNVYLEGVCKGPDKNIYIAFTESKEKKETLFWAQLNQDTGDLSVLNKINTAKTRGQMDLVHDQTLIYDEKNKRFYLSVGESREGNWPALYKITNEGNVDQSWTGFDGGRITIHDMVYARKNRILLIGESDGKPAVLMIDGEGNKRWGRAYTDELSSDVDRLEQGLIMSDHFVIAGLTRKGGMVLLNVRKTGGEFVREKVYNNNLMSPKEISVGMMSSNHIVLSGRKILNNNDTTAIRYVKMLNSSFQTKWRTTLLKETDKPHLSGRISLFPTESHVLASLVYGSGVQFLIINEHGKIVRDYKPKMVSSFRGTKGFVKANGHIYYFTQSLTSEKATKDEEKKYSYRKFFNIIKMKFVR